MSIEIKSFASSSLIAKAKEFRDIIKLPDEIRLPDHKDGLMQYDDNISLIYIEPYKGKMIKNRFDDLELTGSEEVNIIKEMSKEVDPVINGEYPTSLSCWLEKVGKKICIVRCINLKSK